LFSRRGDGQIRSNQVGEEELGKEAYLRKLCDGRQAYWPHSIEKKHGSDFQQAAETVDSRSGMSTARGSYQIQIFFSGAFRILF